MLAGLKRLYRIGDEFGISPYVRQRLVSGGAWVISGKLGTALFGLAVNGLLARLLPPDQMGAYFLALSLATFSSVIAQMGLGPIIVRLVAESIALGEAGRAGAAIRAVFILGAAGAALVALVIALGGGQWVALHVIDSPQLGGVAGLIGLWVVVLTFQALFAEIFRGFHDIRLATLLGGFVTGLGSATLFAGVLVIQGQAELRQILWLSIAAGATNAIIAGVLLRGKVTRLQGDGHIQAPEVLSIAWPVLITMVAAVILGQGGVWVLGAFRSQEEVAIYGAAARLAMFVTSSLAIINAIVPPLIAEMYAQGKRGALQRTLRGVATLAGIPAIVALAILALAGDSVLGLVYGPFYRNGAAVLAVLALGQMIPVWSGLCGPTLLLTGHQKAAMNIAVASGASFVLFGVLVAPSYGAIGVAAVAALSVSA